MFGFGNKMGAKMTIVDFGTKRVEKSKTTMKKHVENKKKTYQKYALMFKIGNIIIKLLQTKSIYCMNACNLGNLILQSLNFITSSY